MFNHCSNLETVIFGENDMKDVLIVQNLKMKI